MAQNAIERRIPADQLPAGIGHDSGRSGYVVTVRVRPYPISRQRFPAGTPLHEMQQWREDEQNRLQSARGESERQQLPQFAQLGLPPLAGGPRAGVTTTLREDIAAYLDPDPLAKGIKIDPQQHEHTKLQAKRYLGKAAAGDLGRYPRNLIPASAWAQLLALWERNGIPKDPEDAALKADGTRRRQSKPAPLSPETYNKVRTCWMTFYTALNGTKATNPIRDVPRRDPGKPEARGIPMEDAIRIVDHVGRSGKPTRTGARLNLMIVLGVRPCEIMRIQPAKDWHRGDHTLVVRTAKGGVARTMLLGARGTAALDSLDALNGWGKFTSAPAARMFADAVRRAGLSKLLPLRPYDLRHSFGTEAYRQTRDLKAVKEAMGHSNIKQTERYTLGAVSDVVAGVCQAIDPAAVKAQPNTKRKRGALHAI